MTSQSEQLIARLREDPNDVDAYTSLKNVYIQQKDFFSLSHLMETWAANVKDKTESSRVFLEAAEITLNDLNDLARTETLLQQAIELDPLNSDASERLISFLESRAEFAKLVEFLDNLINVLASINADPSYMALLYFRLGEIWNRRLQQSEQALHHYQQAIRLDRSLRIAIFEAREICIANRDLARAASLYQLEAEAEPDTDRKISLLCELAQLRSRELNDLDGAVQALRNALNLVPGDIQAMYELAVVLVQRASTKSAEEATKDLRRAAELFFRVAQGVPEEKGFEFVQTALSYAPYHEGALGFLEQLAKKREQSEILPAYWIAYINAVGDGPEVDQRRLYLAKAYTDSGQIEDAIYCLTPAVERGSQEAETLLAELRSKHGSPIENKTTGDEGGTEPRLERDRKADHRRSDAVADSLPRPSPSEGRLTRDEETERSRDAIPDTEETLADVGDTPNQRIAQLRKAVQKLVVARNLDEAATYCREILTLDPSDVEAFTFLESYYKRKRNYAELRDLLLLFTRNAGLSVDVRKLRLREIAAINETKLRDMDGAIDAWVAVVELDPSDSQASKTLKRLLERTKKWDVLIQVLDREALSAINTEIKAELIARIAQIHYEKRNDVVEATEAYRQLYSLRPFDKKTRDLLCDLLLKTEKYEDAVPLLWERIADCTEDKSKLRLLHTLAEVLYDKIAEPEEAYTVCSQILEIVRNDKVAIDRMERIDRELGRYDRLLGSLERRLELSTKGERHALLVEMGKIADEKLSDLKKSADFFNQALELAPRNLETLDLLVAALERSESFDEIIELLNEFAVMQKKPEDRVELYRRIARVHAERLCDRTAAATVWSDLLAIKEDEEALQFMRDVAIENDDVERLADTQKRLLQFEQNPEALRELLFDLAELVDTRLERTGEAITYLRRIVDELDPSFQPALDKLITAYQRIGDSSGLVDVLERRLAVESENEARITFTKQLATIYETNLKDSEQAIRVLKNWVGLDPTDDEPLHRLRELLERTEKWHDLIIALDALIELETDDSKKNAMQIRAAELVHEKLNDVNAAWERLIPLVEQGDKTAEDALRKLAKVSECEEALAAVYIRLAQEATIAVEQAQHWDSAGEVYETYLNKPEQALEAYLRMLATDLDDRSFLEKVERAAAKANAWDRLSRVFDRLIKQAQNTDEKVELLARQADLLDRDAANPSEALDCIVRAFALDPTNDKLLERAEDLGLRVNRCEELLYVYDRRRSQTQNPSEQVEYLIRSAKLAESAIKDRERADTFLKKALEIANASGELLDAIEDTARSFDEQSDKTNDQAARRKLVQSYRDIAEISVPEVGRSLILRASNLVLNELGDSDGGFDVLRFGTTLFPTEEAIFVAISALASETNRLDALDSHLSRLVNDALDSESTIALLERRGKLLEGSLKRFSEAAEVYSKIIQLDHEHEQALHSLYTCLKEAGRYQDLLLAIGRQLRRTDDPEKQLSLRKEIAIIWDVELKNKWEALDAWKKVAKFAPNDEEAKRAIARLDRRSLIPDSDVDDSMDDDIFGLSKRPAHNASENTTKVSDQESIENAAEEEKASHDALSESATEQPSEDDGGIGTMVPHDPQNEPKDEETSAPTDPWNEHNDNEQRMDSATDSEAIPSNDSIDKEDNAQESPETEQIERETVAGEGDRLLPNDSMNADNDENESVSAGSGDEADVAFGEEPGSDTFEILDDMVEEMLSETDSNQHASSKEASAKPTLPALSSASNGRQPSLAPPIPPFSNRPTRSVPPPVPTVPPTNSRSNKPPEED